MFKGLGDLSSLFEQAQQMQEKMTALRAELETKEVDACSGGGMVRARVSGTGLILDLHIEKEVINPDDPQMLQDLVRAACNEAIRKSRELMKEEMSKLTGGLPIPGL